LFVTVFEQRQLPMLAAPNTISGGLHSHASYFVM